MDDSAPDEASRELALARGCPAGEATALGAFERDHLARVPRALAHLRLAPREIDEVVQHVRAKLLVETSESGEARIVSYADGGRLHGLVKVIAVRAALDLVRHEKRDAPGEGALSLLPSPERDPELPQPRPPARARAITEREQQRERPERRTPRERRIVDHGAQRPSATRSFRPSLAIGA